MTVHTHIRAMTVAITAFIICLSLFTTATLLTQRIHHGVLVSSLTFRMSKTMIVRLDRPRGSRRSCNKELQMMAFRDFGACAGIFEIETDLTSLK